MSLDKPANGALPPPTGPDDGAPEVITENYLSTCFKRPRSERPCQQKMFSRDLTEHVWSPVGEK